MDNDSQGSNSAKMAPNSCWVCKSDFPNKMSLSNHFDNDSHKTNCTKVCKELTKDFDDPSKNIVTSMKLDPNKHVPGLDQVFEYRFGPKLDRAFFLCQLCVTIPLSRERMKSHLEGRKHLLNHVLKFKPTLHEKMIGLEKRDKPLFVAKVKLYATQSEKEHGGKPISVKVNPNITDEDINTFKQGCGQTVKTEEAQVKEEESSNSQDEPEVQKSEGDDSDNVDTSKADIFCKVCDMTFSNTEELFVHNTTDDHYQKVGNVLKTIEPGSKSSASVTEDGDKQESNEDTKDKGKDKDDKEEKSEDNKDSWLLPTPKTSLLGDKPKKSNSRSRSTERRPRSRSRHEYDELQDYYKQRSRKDKNREKSNTTRSNSRGRNEKRDGNRKRGILGSPPRERSTKHVPSIFDINPLQVNNQIPQRQQMQQQQSQRMNQMGMTGMNPMMSNQMNPLQMQNQRLQMQRMMNQRQMEQGGMQNQSRMQNQGGMQNQVGMQNQGNTMNQNTMQNMVNQRQMQAIENQRRMQLLANQTQLMAARNQNPTQANNTQLQNSLMKAQSVANQLSQQALLQTPGRSSGMNTMQMFSNLNNSGNSTKVKSLLDMDIGAGPSERKRSRFDSSREAPRSNRNRDNNRSSSSQRSKKGLLGDVPKGSLLPYRDDDLTHEDIDRGSYDHDDLYLAELELERDIQRRSQDGATSKSLLGTPPKRDVSKKSHSRWEGTSSGSKGWEGISSGSKGWEGISSDSKAWGGTSSASKGWLGTSSDSKGWGATSSVAKGWGATSSGSKGWEGTLSGSKAPLLDDPDSYSTYQTSSKGQYTSPSNKSSYSASNSLMSSSYHQSYDAREDHYVDPNDESAILKALEKAQEKKKPKLIDATDEDALMAALDKVRQRKTQEDSRPSVGQTYDSSSGYQSVVAYPFQSSYQSSAPNKSVPSLLGDSPQGFQTTSTSSSSLYSSNPSTNNTFYGQRSSYY